ncbi:competence type IV pilus major pilin ComGC [Terrilactibacillus sp. S3-3]|nr:competence type IV pilus major pilin ComGC [Terrilactibacillus sp. S3-3]
MLEKIKLTQDGFTLIEMMIVLMIISILLLILSLPNMIKSHQVVETKSCKATVQLVQSQVGTYEMEHDGELPTLQELLDNDYVDNITCPNGKTLTLDSDGKVHEPE